MESLRSIYHQSGFTNVRSYVQSGNVIFESSESNLFDLTQLIETNIVRSFGFSVTVIIRHKHQLQRILADNPFLQNRQVDPNTLHVTFLYQPPPETAWNYLTSPVGIPDEFAIGESAIYLYCPNGYGKTRLTNGFFERKLGTFVTTRNWNTVNALNKIASEDLAA